MAHSARLRLVFYHGLRTKKAAASSGFSFSMRVIVLFA
jgi:hypothetical protein